MDNVNKIKPKVTVLMSCYNGAKWLTESLSSVLNQSFRDFEFIFIDDGSSDNSLQIAQVFSDTDSRLKIISNDNIGLTRSLNIGIELSKGDWIARIDADDIWESYYLEYQVQAIEIDKSLVYVGSGMTEIDESGAVIKAHKFPVDHKSLVKRLEKLEKFPPHSSAFYKTSHIRSIGGYRPRFRRSQDYDLWLRLSRIGKLGSTDLSLVRVRKHINQVSNEASGMNTILDSRIALISYFLVSKGLGDPISYSEKDFIFFKEWVENKLQIAGNFEAYSTFKTLKEIIGSSKYSFWGFYRSSFYFITNLDLLFNFILFYFYPSSNIRKITNSWEDLLRSPKQ